MNQTCAEFIPLKLTILTVSDRRTDADDTSGHYLRDASQEQGHCVMTNAIVKENRYAIRARVSEWIADEDVQVVLINGGTGFTEGDCVPEALRPLFDREVEGFGEAFRMFSYKAETVREARAEAFIAMDARTLNMILEGSHHKGDVFATARIAGIQAAKRTWELIPLCHPLLLSRVEV